APLALANGQRLEADRVIAWDEQQSDTTLSIASIDHAGVAKLTHALTHLENRLHLQIVERRRDKVVGSITLDLSLRRASPLRKVTLESIESEFRVANQSEFPVRLLATLSPHVRRDGRELAQGRRLSLPHAAPTHIDAELDLRGLAPLDLFRIAGDRTTPRTACFAVPGAAEARFPGIDGSPGTGRYIDLDRSRVVIRVRDELGRELPGCARTLADLARDTGQFELRFTLMAGVRCEFQLELHGYDAATDAPATLSFSLPWRDGDGVEHLQQRVGRNDLEERLWRASQRPVADHPLEAAP
ncbi:MAG TPA: hypothetical protein PLV92_27825, partial [Pirellulaceae bacterium]|nr:hypothetical protein [Pirellulaceae bacterium]